MTKSDRGSVTRRRILEAAAEVFEREGYQAATVTDIIEQAGVTKGALYFHFPSKEGLVEGIFASQDFGVCVPQRVIKLQELIDTVHVYVFRLRTETLFRAGFRLSLDARGRNSLADVSPFKEWKADMLRTLRAAASQGELLPHIEPLEEARLWVSTFMGFHLMSESSKLMSESSQSESTHSDHASTESDSSGLVSSELVSEDPEDPGGLGFLLCHLLSSIAVPSVLAGLDLSSERGPELASSVEERSPANGMEASIPRL